MVFTERDGLLYYVVVFVSNICWILFHIIEFDKLASLHVHLPVSLALITGMVQGRYSIEYMPLSM